MPTLALNTVPAERSRGCRFAELFMNSTLVGMNGATLYGSPSFTLDGIVLDGVSQRALFSLTGDEFNSVGITIVCEFTPDFESDANADYVLFDTTATKRYMVAKVNNAGANRLQIMLGDTLIESVNESVYGPYWNVGEVNQIIISGTTGNTSAWINGNLILDAKNTAWTEKDPTELVCGSYATGSDFFHGKISLFKCFNSALEADEIIDIINGTTFAYTDDIILDLPCDAKRDDETYNKIKDISQSRNHATKGDGVNENTFPVKYADQNGYKFSGLSYISGITEPTGDFTIAMCKRVSEDVTVSFENGLRALDDLSTAGQFEGDLLGIRIFPRILTLTQQYNEEFILLDRVNIDLVPSGCIQKLIASGDCILFHDYRSGSFHDYSNYGNHGVPNAATVWDGDALSFDASNAEVYITDSPELLISEGSIVVLLDVDAAVVTEKFVNKVSGALRASIFSITHSGTKLTYFDGNYTRTLDYTPLGDKCLAINFQTTQIPEAFANGEFIGNFSGVSDVLMAPTDMTIGYGTAGSNHIKAVLIANRKLTHKEHNRIYQELNKNVFYAEVIEKETVNFADHVAIDDPSLIAAYCESNKKNILTNLKNENLFPVTLNGQICRSGFFKSVFNYSAGKSLSTGITSAILDPKKQKHTVSCWIKLNALPADTSQPIFLFGKGLATSAFAKPYCGGIIIEAEINGSNLSYYHYDAKNAVLKSISTAYGADIDIWHHVVYTVDHVNDIAKLYVNGELVGSCAVGTMYTSGTIEADSFRIFGMNAASASVADAPNTELSFFQIHDEAKSAEWVLEQFELGAAALAKTGFADQESIIADSDLTNSLFTNASNFLIVNETIDNKKCKVIESQLDGSEIYLNVKHLA